MHRPITTSRPASLAMRYASSSMMPCWSQGLRPDRDGLARDLRRVLGSAEHVDHVDPDVGRDVQERRERAFAQDLGLVEVHGHDPISLRLQEARHLMGRPVRPRGEADDGDRAGAAEERS
jgi:hypothetical protein